MSVERLNADVPRTYQNLFQQTAERHSISVLEVIDKI